MPDITLGKWLATDKNSSQCAPYLLNYLKLEANQWLLNLPYTADHLALLLDPKAQTDLQWCDWSQLLTLGDYFLKLLHDDLVREALVYSGFSLLNHDYFRYINDFNKGDLPKLLRASATWHTDHTYLPRAIAAYREAQYGRGPFIGVHTDGTFGRYYCSSFVQLAVQHGLIQQTSLQAIVDLPFLAAKIDCWDVMYEQSLATLETLRLLFSLRYNPQELGLTRMLSDQSRAAFFAENPALLAELLQCDWHNSALNITKKSDLCDWATTNDILAHRSVLRSQPQQYVPLMIRDRLIESLGHYLGTKSSGNAKTRAMAQLKDQLVSGVAYPNAAAWQSMTATFQEGQLIVSLSQFGLKADKMAALLPQLFGLLSYNPNDVVPLDFQPVPQVLIAVPTNTANACSTLAIWLEHHRQNCTPELVAFFEAIASQSTLFQHAFSHDSLAAMWPKNAEGLYSIRPEAQRILMNPWLQAKLNQNPLYLLAMATISLHAATVLMDPDCQKLLTEKPELLNAFYTISAAGADLWLNEAARAALAGQDWSKILALGEKQLTLLKNPMLAKPLVECKYFYGLSELRVRFLITFLENNTLWQSDPTPVTAFLRWMHDLAEKNCSSYWTPIATHYVSPFVQKALLTERLGNVELHSNSHLWHFKNALWCVLLDNNAATESDFHILRTSIFSGQVAEKSVKLLTDVFATDPNITPALRFHLLRTFFDISYVSYYEVSLRKVWADPRLRAHLQKIPTDTLLFCQRQCLVDAFTAYLANATGGKTGSIRALLAALVRDDKVAINDAYCVTPARYYNEGNLLDQLKAHGLGYPGMIDAENSQYHDWLMALRVRQVLKAIVANVLLQDDADLSLLVSPFVADDQSRHLPPIEELPVPPCSTPETMQKVPANQPLEGLVRQSSLTRYDL